MLKSIKKVIFNLTNNIDGGFVDESGSENEDDMDQNSSDDEKEYQRVMNKIKNINDRKKELESQGKTPDDIDISAEEDDDSDSDYEYAGGNLALYDSALDKIDELQFIKETFEGLSQDQQYYQQLM